MEKPTLFFDETVELAKRGCQKSISKIYKDNYEFAVKLAWSFSSSKEETDELACLGMMRAFKSINQWNGSGPFQGWLRTVLRRAYISHFREKMGKLERAKIVSVEPDGFQLDVEDPTKFSDFTVIELIEKGLQTVLCENQRRTFELVGLKQFTYEDAAKELGTTLGTVKSNMFDARTKLKKYCAQMGIKKA